MGFGRIIRFAICALVVTTLLSGVASAQRFTKPLRWLGEGYSAGYNRCNPGPNSDYYNPWNAHNSMLISQLPQFQNQNFQSYNMNNLMNRPIYQGVPFSVYAAPQSQNNYGYGMHSVQSVQGTYSGSEGNSVQSSFEPYDVKEDEAEEEEEETDDDDEWNDDENDWQADEDEIETEDENNDDTSKIQAPVPTTPGESVFSNAGFQLNQPPAQPSSEQPNLFNPFN